MNPAALEDLVRLCVELDRLRHHPGTGHDDTGTGSDGDGERRQRRHWRRRHWRRPGRARPGHRAGLGGPRACDHRQGGRPAIRPRRAGVVPAPPAARRPPGRAEPAAGHRLRRDHPGRDPQRGHPAGPALPVARRLQPARLGLRGAPCQAQGQRRQDQHSRLRSTLLVSPPGCHPPVGLDAGPEPRRYHHRVEPGQNQGPTQPRSTGPPGVTPGGPTTAAAMRPARHEHRMTPARETRVRAVSRTVRDLRTRSAPVPTRPYAAAAATGPRRARTRRSRTARCGSAPPRMCGR